MKLLFKNAYIVDVQSPYHLQTVDVLVDEDQIVSVGALGEISAKHTIDLNGSTLTTGFAELHSDLGEPGNEESEDLNSGSAAAAAGKASIDQVVIAVAEAETTLATVVAVRDKVLEAYREILRMPI